jgi:hypothetical protein
MGVRLLIFKTVGHALTKQSDLTVSSKMALQCQAEREA